VTRFACLAALCGLALVVAPADPQGFGPHHKGKGAAVGPRPTPHAATPAFTRPSAPAGGLGGGRAIVPSRGFVPSRPAAPQLTRPTAPLIQPTAPSGMATAPIRPTRPSVTTPTAPSPTLGTTRLPQQTTRPALVDPALRGTAGGTTLNRPRFVNKPDVSRTNIYGGNVYGGNRYVDRSRTVNRWGGGTRQVGAPRTWYSQPRNWNRTWWGDRPAWYWGRPWYWQHARWHHGYWNYWAAPPTLWFGTGLLGGWLLGPGDSFAYYNPYWVAPAYVPTYLDYSEPLPVVSVEQEAVALPPDPDTLADPDAAPATATDPTAAEANRLLDAARESFRNGEYAKAQEQVETAVRLTPSDPALHEFRALTLFAQAKYQEAAAALYAVLTAGPGWDWPTLRDQYPDVDTYTAQLRALERFVGERPEAGYGHFLLAYHYLVTENRDAAVRELRETVRLQPDDKLSQALLTSLTTNEAAGGVGPAPAPGR
jgi:Tetratricopeptide repeat